MAYGFLLLLGIALIPGAGQSQGHCLKALAALPEGSIPVSEKFRRVDCPSSEAPAAAFRYDRVQGSSHLSRSILEGEVVPIFPEFEMRLVQPGQTLLMVISTGAARIERKVEALQTARPGQKLFVRSADGQILSARYEIAP
jgi:flagella basal body P-ring formation protein FlgA